MTPATVQFTPIVDALLRDPITDHVVELPVLGLSMRFETNSPQVLDAVEESFGCWRQLDPVAVTVTSDPLRVRLVVYGDTNSRPTDAARAEVRHICPDATRMLIQSSHAVGISDPDRREAVAYVSAELVVDRVHFRAAVLDALTWSLLAHFDRHPVHAAAIGVADRVLLLAASSGTGKSTIAYVAHRSGLTVLSDDRVWIQLEPTLRVWSAPRPLRLLPGTVVLFPELASQPQVEIDGKRKINVTSGGCIAPGGDGGVVTCVMRRGNGAPSLESLGSESIAAALEEQLAPGFDRYPVRRRAVMRMLAEPGGWLLTLGRSPEEALPLVLEVLKP